MRQVLVASVAALLMAATSAAPAHAGSVFGASSYAGTFSLDATSPTPMGAAFDGTNYYTASGGGPGSPEGQLDSSGTLINSVSPTPGVDFRSIFTDSSGAVYAKGYNSNVIYQQTSFGQFTSIATLNGLTNAQEGVVLDSNGSRYVGLDGNVVQEWDLQGNLIGTVTLSSAPSANTVSAFGNNWLIYGNGTLYAFDNTTGALVDSTTLTGVDSNSESYYGQSYANGYFFLGNNAGGYQGFQIGTPAQVPEPASMAVVGAGLFGLTLFKRRRSTSRQ